MYLAASIFLMCLFLTLPPNNNSVIDSNYLLIFLVNLNFNIHMIGFCMRIFGWAAHIRSRRLSYARLGLILV